jgi:hypothetical protein
MSWALGMHPIQRPSAIPVHAITAVMRDQTTQDTIAELTAKYLCKDPATSKLSPGYRLEGDIIDVAREYSAKTYTSTTGYEPGTDAAMSQFLDYNQVGTGRPCTLDLDVPGFLGDHGLDHHTNNALGLESGFGSQLELRSGSEHPGDTHFVEAGSGSTFYISPGNLTQTLEVTCDR